MAKLFVGQLDYQTTEEELQHLFEEAGAVSKATIITRGGRSLGYGFVEFENEADSEKAVEKFNQASFKERTLKVEHARPPTAATEQPARRRYPAYRGRPRRSYPPAHASDSGAAPAPTQAYPPRAQAPAPTQAYPPRPRNAYNNTNNYNNNNNYNSGYAPRPYRRPTNNYNNNYNEGYNNNYNAAPQEPYTGGRRYTTNPNNRRRPTGNRPVADNTTQTAPPPASGTTAAAPKPRARRADNAPQAPKIVSKTAVFVANLPFSVTDEGLSKIFEEYTPKHAHVVKTRNGRSRGYGFVDFETEEDQKKAIEAKNQQLVDDDRSTAEKPRDPRKITVTISHSAPAEQQQ